MKIKQVESFDEVRNVKNIDKMIKKIFKRNKKKPELIKREKNYDEYKTDAVVNLYKMKMDENVNLKNIKLLIPGTVVEKKTQLNKFLFFTFINNSGFLYFTFLHTFKDVDNAKKYLKRKGYNIIKANKEKDNIELIKKKMMNFKDKINKLFYKNSLFPQIKEGNDIKRLILDSDNFKPANSIFENEFYEFSRLVHLFKTTFNLEKLIEMFNSKTEYKYIDQVEENKNKFEILRIHLYEKRKANIGINKDYTIQTLSPQGDIITENILKYKDDDIEIYYSDKVLKRVNETIEPTTDYLQNIITKYNCNKVALPHIWMDGTGGVPQTGDHIGKQIVYVLVFDIILEKYRVLLMGIISDKMNSDKWVIFLKLINEVFNYSGVSTDNEKSLVTGVKLFNKKHYGDISHYQRRMISFSIKDKKKIRTNIMKIFKYWPLANDRNALFNNVVFLPDEKIVYDWIKTNYFNYFSNLIETKNDYKKFQTSVVEGMQNKWKYFRKYNTIFDSLRVFMKNIVFYIQKSKSTSKMQFITEPFLKSLLLNIPDEYYKKMKSTKFQTIDQSKQKEPVYITSIKFESDMSKIKKQYESKIKLANKHIDAYKFKAAHFENISRENIKLNEVITKLNNELKIKDKLEEERKKKLYMENMINNCLS